MNRFVNAVLAIVVLMGASSCDESSPAPSEAISTRHSDSSSLAADSGVATLGHLPEDLDALLTESWYSNGDRGYFLDPSDVDFSLIATRSWSNYLKAAGEPAKVPLPDRRSLRATLEGYLRNPESEDGSALPSLAKLELATRACVELNLQCDLDLAARSLGSFREGGNYTWEVRGRGGRDWGSNAAAVRIIGLAGQRVPRDVSEALAANLRKGWRRIDVPSLSEAMLVATEIGVPVPQNQVRRLKKVVAGDPYMQISFVSGLIQQGLHPRLVADDPLCQEFSSDAQSLGSVFSAQLMIAGCTKSVSGPPDPWGSIGWPSSPSVASVARDSTYGYEIARSLGRSEEFSAELRASVSSWSADPESASQTLVARARLTQVLGMESSRIGTELDDAVASGDMTLEIREARRSLGRQSSDATPPGADINGQLLKLSQDRAEGKSTCVVFDDSRIPSPVRAWAACSAGPVLEDPMVQGVTLQAVVLRSWNYEDPFEWLPLVS